ncbi:PTS lactose transporter subunit IIBC [Marinilactibacillus psychrotolerans]|uniref:PTS system lactose-specific EIICB component n=1 Tax=Marinilactibacillus psychrotolerans TaxID=191770 RepID=A0ABW8UPG9_9LACT
MNSLIAQIEKAQPFFEKLSRNKYLRAIKDGFTASMPVILFSSLFMLVANLPEVFGYHWSEATKAWIMKPYSYTMGIVGLLVASNTSKALTDSFNGDLPNKYKLNSNSISMGAISGFLILSVGQIENGFATEFMGTSGLITSFVAAILTVHIYKFFVTREIIITMPEEVPPNISQAFADIAPFAATISVTLLVDFVIRSTFGTSFAEWLISIFQPLFTASDGYLGLAIIAGAMSFFWFIGIHGPSIVRPATSAVEYLNIDINIQTHLAGGRATKLLTDPARAFVMTLGGTGATLVVPYLFMFFSKSKRNKAVGKATFIPSTFAVNEPILFGAPIILNPVFFIPFILAPIINIWIFKIFVEFLGMTAFIFVLPWTIPGPIGIPIAAGFHPLSFVLALVLIVVDALIYLPFFKVYDNQVYEDELAAETNKDENKAIDVQEENTVPNTPEISDDVVPTTNIVLDDKKHVLVLCAGGGTSGLLSNALNKASEKYDAPLEATAGSYGSHNDILKDYDLVVLAPQVASNYETIKKDTDKLGIKLIKTKGQEYISLTNDPEKAMDFVLDKF